MPYRAHYLGDEGRRQHFLDEGDGPPVVMVHGNPTWCCFTTVTWWGACVIASAASCRTISAAAAPMRRRILTTATRFEDRVDDLERLLDERVPEGSIDLVVHDWGGMIGMAWAHRHPHRVRRFVILNTAGFRLPEDQPMPRAIAFARSRAGRWLIERFSLFARSASYLAFSRPVSPAVGRAYRWPYEAPERRVAARRFVEDIPLSPDDPSYQTVLGVEEGLGQFSDRPAMICWGLKDFCIY